MADDAALFREGLVRLLTEGGHDVCSVGDADELLTAVRDAPPDLAVVDVRMPPARESAGAIAALRIRSDFPAVAVLLLSQHVELRHCRTLVGTPGFGYLLKDRVLDLAQFLDAVERVAAGGVAIDPVVVQSLVRGGRGRLDQLTARETEVLAQVAEGHSNTAVAAALQLSERTVETHLRSVFGKLGLHDDGTTNRRVRAVLAYLESASYAAGEPAAPGADSRRT